MWQVVTRVKVVDQAEGMGCNHTSIYKQKSELKRVLMWFSKWLMQPRKSNRNRKILE